MVVCSNPVTVHQNLDSVNPVSPANTFRSTNLIDSKVFPSKSATSFFQQLTWTLCHLVTWFLLWAQDTCTPTPSLTSATKVFTVAVFIDLWPVFRYVGLVLEMVVDCHWNNIEILKSSNHFIERLVTPILGDLNHQTILLKDIFVVDLIILIYLAIHYSIWKCFLICPLLRQ